MHQREEEKGSVIELVKGSEMWKRAKSPINLKLFAKVDNI